MNRVEALDMYRSGTLHMNCVETLPMLNLALISWFVLNPFELILDFWSKILDKNSKDEKLNSKRNYYSISSKSLFICKIEWCADPLSPAFGTNFPLNPNPNLLNRLK